jgi:hypothetical protein
MDATTVFRSKVDWWLALILFSIPGVPMLVRWTRFDTGSLQPSFWIPVIVAAALLVVFVPIRYVIEGETISVQCGVIGWEYTAFHVREVQSVRPTYDILASPALSLDRLSVEMGFRGAILISPKDKAGFLRALEKLDSQLRLQDGSLIRVADTIG